MSLQLAAPFVAAMVVALSARFLQKGFRPYSAQVGNRVALSSNWCCCFCIKVASVPIGHC